MFPYRDPCPYQDPFPQILMLAPYSTNQYPSNVSLFVDTTLNCQHYGPIIYSVM